MSPCVPIRIDSMLLNAASTEGKISSTQKQIEHWVDLGRKVDGLISEFELVALRAGLMKLEPVHSNGVDPDELFTAVEADRPALNKVLKSGRVVYQACAQRPG